jgi:hypothetical protein
MVVHNEASHRFEIAGDHGGAYLEYTRRGEVLDLQHTFVPDSMRGQGAAAQLSRAALEYAREMNFSIIPTCPFVASFFNRHPEYAWLVAKQPPRAD